MTESKDVRRGLNFSRALEMLLDGKRMRRQDWASSWFVCYMPPVNIPYGLVNNRTRDLLPSGGLDVQGYFVFAMDCHEDLVVDSHWQPGWVPTAGELLADDWEEYGTDG